MHEREGESEKDQRNKNQTSKKIFAFVFAFARCERTLGWTRKDALPSLEHTIIAETSIRLTKYSVVMFTVLKLSLFW